MFQKGMSSPGFFFYTAILYEVHDLYVKKNVFFDLGKPYEVY